MAAANHEYLRQVLELAGLEQRFDMIVSGMVPDSQYRDQLISIEALSVGL